MTSAPTTNIPVASPAGQPAGRPGAPGSSTGVPNLPQPATIRGQGQTITSVLGRFFAGTPGRMRLLAVLGVIACLALGAVSVNALITSKWAAERAAVNTEQVVRAQTMQVNLLRADALATNAFLVGGLETADSRAAYDLALADVAKDLTQSAAAQPADKDALGELSTRIQTYAALVEQARSNNRLGLPVGAQYLTQASAGLRADAIPVLGEIVKANENRAGLEFDRSDASVQLFAGVAAIIALALISFWLARRTHRYVNLSLSAAVVLLIAALVLAATTIGSISSAARDVAAGDYRRAVQLAQVHTAANDARANESLTLIRRGSGGAEYEKAWQTNNTTITKALAGIRDGGGTSLLTGWSTYAGQHQAIRDAEVKQGSWDDAVKLATADGTPSAKASFASFENAVTTARDQASKGAIDKLSGLGGSAWAMAVALALAALVAAWLVVRGIGKRIEEYR